MASNNANPVNNIERYWEAIDLVTKALTHQDGPFSWEGKHYTHRHVNIWPPAVAAARTRGCGRRPAIRRRPARWAGAAWSTCWSCAARRGRSARGPPIARPASRPGFRRVSSDHFGYAALLYVGDTHEEGVRIGSKLMWFLNTSLKSAPAVRRSSSPGPCLRTPRPRSTAPPRSRAPRPTARPGARAAGKAVASASQNAATLIGMTAEQAMQARHPVRRQPRHGLPADHGLRRQGRRRFGHLVMVGRSGHMTHAEAEKGIKLFAREVLPRLKEIAPVTVG